MFLDRRVALPAVFQANEIICMRNPAVLSPCLLKATQKLIEDQIAALNIAKDDALLSKYNLEAIVKFMKEKFANFGHNLQNVESKSTESTFVFDYTFRYDVELSGLVEHPD